MTLVTDIIPRVMEMIAHTPFMLEDKCMDGEVIIACKDKAYAITGNFNVYSIEEMYISGSGGLTAFGSLYTSKYTTMTPESRVMLAIIAAGSKVQSVSKEAYIGDTKGTPFRKINTIKYVEK